MEDITQLFNNMSTELYAAIYMGVFLVVLGLAPFIAKILSTDFLTFYKKRESIRLEGWGIRAEKSVTNLYESLPLFMILAIIIQMQGLNSDTTAMGAIIFCVSRTVHPIAYILNVPPLRTLGYAGGLVGMLMMGLAFF